MGAQRILALTSKRAEISECIRILRDKPSSSRGSPSLNQLLERLQQKLEWLDKCIDLEQQQSDPISWTAVAKAPHANNAA
jgi:predicted metal-dependent hydrolase